MAMKKETDGNQAATQSSGVNRGSDSVMSTLPPSDSPSSETILQAKERTLADYRPQHDSSCTIEQCQTCFVWSEFRSGHIEKYGHYFEAGPCTCGLDALLAVSDQAPQAQAPSPASSVSVEQDDVTLALDALLNEIAVDLTGNPNAILDAKYAMYTNALITAVRLDQQEQARASKNGTIQQFIDRVAEDAGEWVRPLFESIVAMASEQARAPRFNDPDEKFAFDNGSGSTEVMTTAEMIAEIQRLGLRCVELHTQSEQARAEIERLDKENRQMNQTLATTALDVFHAVERAELAESQLTEARATTAQLKARRFPIQGGPDIPWSVIAPCERQARLRLREQGKEQKEHEKDSGAGLIHQIASPLAETEPRLNYDNPDVLRSGLIHLRVRVEENLDASHYREYHLEVIDAALALLSSAGLPRPTCAWALDADERGDSWDSQCGEKWCFIEGDPTKNKIRFCQGCGGRVTLLMPSAPQETETP